MSRFNHVPSGDTLHRDAISSFIYLFIQQVHQRGNTENVNPLSQSYLVELSVAAHPGHDQVQDDIRNFAEQLKPYPFVNFIETFDSVN